ncbi:hypothetical protein ACP275_03G121600 [Erythranthe tilingii]
MGRRQQRQRQRRRFDDLLHALAFILPIISAINPALPKTLPLNCTASCGGVAIPYPFGTTENCYQHSSFNVTCNTTFRPHKLFLAGTQIQITNITLDGQIKVLHFIAHDCYDRSGTRVFRNNPFIQLPVHLTVNNNVNKFTIVGCDAYGYVSGRRLNRKYTTGCTAMCESLDDLEEGSCMGSGCCQTSIPEDVSRVNLQLESFWKYRNVSDFNNCGHAFLVEESAFNFSRDSLTTLRNVEKLPLVVDWAIANGTCQEAQTNTTSYACVSPNSKCYKPQDGYGYRCRCVDGYDGNPYLSNGCVNINECEDASVSKCKHGCIDTEGGFDCLCPNGYHEDGDDCRRGESLTIKLVAGSALGVIILLLSACLLYLELKRRKSNRRRQEHFLQNGGFMLLEKLATRERSQDMVKIFTAAELQKATNDFNNDMIIGQGGFGTVYKGLLSDNTVVAIKRSKRVDPDQTEQFINEVLILSQVNHRNVVRLLGCCFETEVPLLVYEFVDNGTLSSHVHNREKASCLNWETRLRIAAETAGVLSYLHSSAATPIIHRDVKSDNILLDHTFTAKVADFGASRLVPIDHTQLSTMVQGTFGYLDPEYMQTNQLTEKSDVYSFGVVLLELLTGRGAISFNKPEEEKNLSYFFLSMLKQDRILEILDDSIIGRDDKNRESQIMEVAKLAKGCLYVRGEDRPSMMEVTMELEGLRLGGKHAWARKAEDGEETKSLLRDRLNEFVVNGGGDGNYTTVGYDSITDQIVVPTLGGGR